jgi:hypothetical protein
LIEIVANKFQVQNLEDLDSNLATYVKEKGDIESAIEKLHEAITLTCEKPFKIRENTNKETTQKSVPWWTVDLTIKKNIECPEKTVSGNEK